MKRPCIVCLLAFVNVFSGNVAINKIGLAGSNCDPENSFPEWLCNGRTGEKAGGVWLPGDPHLNGEAYMGVDLCKIYNITRVVLKWHSLQGCYGSVYTVKVAASWNGAWQTVASVSSGDGGIDDLSFTATQARFVRVYPTAHGACDWNVALLEEIEVYGDGDAQSNSSLTAQGLTCTPLDESNLRLQWNKVNGASGYVVRRDHYLIAGVIDNPNITTLEDYAGTDVGHLYEILVVNSQGQAGSAPAYEVCGPLYTGNVVSRYKPTSASSMNVRWSPPQSLFCPGKTVSNNHELENRGWMAAGSSNEWMSVDLGEVHTVSAVNTVWNGYHGPASEYYIEISLNGSTWSRVRSSSGTFTPTEAKFVRIFAVSGGVGGGIALSKLEVIGTRPATGTKSLPNVPHVSAVQGAGEYKVVNVYDMSGRLAAEIKDKGWCEGILMISSKRIGLNGGMYMVKKISYSFVESR